VSQSHLLINPFRACGFDTRSVASNLNAALLQESQYRNALIVYFKHLF
jgi:hypothetical protein